MEKQTSANDEIRLQKRRLLRLLEELEDQQHHFKREWRPNISQQAQYDHVQQLYRSARDEIEERLYRLQREERVRR